MPLWWSVASDVIWHIYSHLHCFTGNGGRESQSSGQATLTMGQVPCKFRADWLTFIFQPVTPDMIWHIYSSQHCWGLKYRPTVFSGLLPSLWGRAPVSFEQISQPSFFSQRLLTWFGTFTCTCTAPWGMVVGICHLQRR